MLAQGQADRRLRHILLPVRLAGAVGAVAAGGWVCFLLAEWGAVIAGPLRPLGGQIGASCWAPFCSSSSQPYCWPRRSHRRRVVAASRVNSSSRLSSASELDCRASWLLRSFLGAGRGSRQSCPGGLWFVRAAGRRLRGRLTYPPVAVAWAVILVGAHRDVCPVSVAGFGGWREVWCVLLERWSWAINLFGPDSLCTTRFNYLVFRFIVQSRSDHRS